EFPPVLRLCPWVSLRSTQATPVDPLFSIAQAMPPPPDGFFFAATKGRPHAPASNPAEPDQETEKNHRSDSRRRRGRLVRSVAEFHRSIPDRINAYTPHRYPKSTIDPAGRHRPWDRPPHDRRNHMSFQQSERTRRRSRN